jgi:predicted DCC family thiol-disulfide oxidoreductase YuxK
MSVPKLPHAEKFPDRDVVIYDGSCRFCQSQVAKLAHWDSEQVLAFVPLQHELVAERYSDLTRDMLLKEMYLVSRQGVRFGGVHALREIAQRLRRLRWLRFWFRIPLAMPISRLVYRTIAKVRYRLWGRVNRCDHGTCDVHFD